MTSAKFADWKPYTNPRTKKSGWVSGGGMVRYDDPRTQNEQKQKTRATAQEAFDATKSGAKIGVEHVDAMRAHLNSLTRDQKRELAKSVSAHVGGLKSQLVDRLLAYAKGEPQPPYPKKPRSQSLVAIVQGYGGIDPKSHDLKTTYSNMREAIQDGINLGVFRKGGRGLDVLAEEMHDDGYIQVPADRHAGEYLLEQIKAGVKSRHADASHEYDAALEEYHRAEQEAEDYKKTPEGKKRARQKPKKVPEPELIPFADATGLDPFDKFARAGAKLEALKTEVKELNTVGAMLEKSSMKGADVSRINNR